MTDRYLSHKLVNFRKQSNRWEVMHSLWTEAAENLHSVIAFSVGTLSSYRYFSQTFIPVRVVSVKYWMFLRPNIFPTPKSSIRIWRIWTAWSTFTGSSAHVWKRLPATLFATDSDDIVLNSEWLTIRNHVPKRRAINFWTAGDKLEMMLIQT